MYSCVDKMDPSVLLTWIRTFYKSNPDQVIKSRHNTGFHSCIQVYLLSIAYTSVSDPYSSNPDPDPAKNLNPDPDPSYFFTLSEKIKIMLLL